MGEQVENPTPPATTASEELAELLRYVRESTQATGSFVKEQAPDVAMQIVAYERLRSTSIYVSLLLVLSIIMAILFKNRDKIRKNCHENHDPPLYGIGMTIFSLIFAIIFIFQGVWVLRTWFAPKLIVIDYIRSMM